MTKVQHLANPAALCISVTLRPLAVFTLVRSAKDSSSSLPPCKTLLEGFLPSTRTISFSTFPSLTLREHAFLGSYTAAPAAKTTNEMDIIFSLPFSFPFTLSAPHQITFLTHTHISHIIMVRLLARNQIASSIKRDTWHEWVMFHQRRGTALLILFGYAHFDTTTAQIVKSGFNAVSLQDCREPDGSWNMTDWACHPLSTRYRM
ncbi:hypothetical protein EV702DRAFT_752375 [Suillus placidus]|uniref:Uncharacterized protein n=1 Tax=Suillus placidus TaxID=48579 RepID=A0A9P6ZID1_9AGAM|nr:hypothetical protein EV702DRAFT_752375 [Suillus placidus]